MAEVLVHGGLTGCETTQSTERNKNMNWNNLVSVLVGFIIASTLVYLIISFPLGPRPHNESLVKSGDHRVLKVDEP
ncbi:MAG: hypothetical protein Q7R69_00940 [bacterium]|nr:hypothetical protein [bacterium]